MWDCTSTSFLFRTSENTGSGGENTGIGAMVPGWEQNCPHCRALLTLATAFIDTTTLQTGFLLRSPKFHAGYM